MRTLKKSCVIFVALVAAALTAVAPGSAQSAPGAPSLGPQVPAGERPNLLRDVGYDQKLNAQIPGDIVFRDDTGKPVQLSQYFGKRPIVLALAYYECPMLCTQVLNDMVTALKLVT